MGQESFECARRTQFDLIAELHQALLSVTVRGEIEKIVRDEIGKENGANLCGCFCNKAKGQELLQQT